MKNKNLIALTNYRNLALIDHENGKILEEYSILVIDNYDFEIGQNDELIISAGINLIQTFDPFQKSFRNFHPNCSTTYRIKSINESHLALICLNLNMNQTFVLFNKLNDKNVAILNMTNRVDEIEIIFNNKLILFGHMYTNHATIFNLETFELIDLRLSDIYYKMKKIDEIHFVTINWINTTIYRLNNPKVEEIVSVENLNPKCLTIDEKSGAILTGNSDMTLNIWSNYLTSQPTFQTFNLSYLNSFPIHIFARGKLLI